MRRVRKRAKKQENVICPLCGDPTVINPSNLLRRHAIVYNTPFSHLQDGCRASGKTLEEARAMRPPDLVEANG